jgi:hypothetical protein
MRLTMGIGHISGSNPPGINVTIDTVLAALFGSQPRARPMPMHCNLC